MWVKNVAKKRHDSGLEYVSDRKKVVPDKFLSALRSVMIVSVWTT